MVTNNSSNIPTGNSGSIVQSQGVGTPFSLSTATYPSSAGTSGNVLQSDGTNFSSSALYTSNPIGSLSYFGIGGSSGSTYPNANWLICDGSVYSQATYPVLFSRLGLLGTGQLSWTLKTSGTTSNITALTYGNSLYVYGASNGGIFTSTDANTWTSRTSGTAIQITSLIYENSLFAYCNNSARVATSTDAITWSGVNTGTGIRILSYGNSLYVGISGLFGGATYPYSSTDAITWTRRSYPFSSISNNYNSCLSYGNSTFCIGTYLGQFTTSTNGITWKTKTPYISQQTLCFGAGVLVGSALGSAVTSTDSKVFTAYDTAPVSGSELIYENSLFVLGGQVGQLSTSTNAQTWTSRTSGTASLINSICYGNSLYVYGTNNGGISTSTDAITWTARTSGTTSDILCLVYGNSLYVYGTRGSGISTSTDAITWNAQTSGTASDITNLVYGNSLYVYGTSGGGGISTSTDAITWTARTSGVSAQISDLLYGNSIYVFSSGNSVSTSTDGTTWVSSGNITSNGISSLLYNGSKYYAASQQGPLLTSDNAINWTENESYPTAPAGYYSMVYGSKFVAAGSGGVISTSTNGSEWVLANSNTSSDIFSLTYGNGSYTYCGNGGVFGTSTDGITWTSGVSATVSSLSAISYGSGIFVAGGTSGVLEISGPTYTYNPVIDFQVPTDAQTDSNSTILTTQNQTNFKRRLFIRAL